MTCIAYRDGVLAADTLVTEAGSAFGQMRKITRVLSQNGCILLGAAGWAVNTERFLATSGDAAKIAAMLADVEGAFIGISVVFGQTPDPRVTIYEPKGSYDLTECDYVAIGCGGDVARGAMFMGASAFDAVKAAIHLRRDCGGRVIMRGK